MNPSRSFLRLGSFALFGLGALILARSVRSRRAAATDASFGARGAASSVAYGTGTRIDKAFTIARSPDELYAAWRNLEQLPAIFSHIERVEVIDERRSHWHARGPQGVRASWDAELITDEPGHRIAWRSTSGAMPNAGTVTFSPAPGGRGTELHVEIEWKPPGGALGASFAHLFGDDPGLIVETDLRRFKSTMESGALALNGTDVTS